MRGSRIAGALLWLVLAAVPARAAKIPYRLADINQTSADPPSNRLSEEPSNFFELGGRLLFSTAGSATDEGILWSTDGTAAGTVQISSSICPLPCRRHRPAEGVERHRPAADRESATAFSSYVLPPRADGRTPLPGPTCWRTPSTPSRSSDRPAPSTS